MKLFFMTLALVFISCKMARTRESALFENEKDIADRAIGFNSEVNGLLSLGQWIAQVDRGEFVELFGELPNGLSQAQYAQEMIRNGTEFQRQLELAQSSGNQNMLNGVRNNIDHVLAHVRNGLKDRVLIERFYNDRIIDMNNFSLSARGMFALDMLSRATHDTVKAIPDQTREVVQEYQFNADQLRILSSVGIDINEIRNQLEQNAGTNKLGGANGLNALYSIFYHDLASRLFLIQNSELPIEILKTVLLTNEGHDHGAENDGAEAGSWWLEMRNAPFLKAALFRNRAKEFKNPTAQILSKSLVLEDRRQQGLFEVIDGKLTGGPVKILYQIKASKETFVNPENLEKNVFKNNLYQDAQDTRQWSPEELAQVKIFEIFSDGAKSAVGGTMFGPKPGQTNAGYLNSIGQNWAIWNEYPNSEIARRNFAEVLASALIVERIQFDRESRRVVLMSADGNIVPNQKFDSIEEALDICKEIYLRENAAIVQKFNDSLARGFLPIEITRIIENKLLLTGNNLDGIRENPNTWFKRNQLKLIEGRTRDTKAKPTQEGISRERRSRGDSISNIEKQLKIGIGCNDLRNGYQSRFE